VVFALVNPTLLRGLILIRLTLLRINSFSPT